MTDTVLQGFGRHLQSRWKRLKLFDKNLVFYFSFLSMLILIFQQNLDNAFLHFTAHIAAIGVLLMIIPWLDQHEGKVALFFRYWYIVIGLPFLYLDLGAYLHLISPLEFDPLILKFESTVFGVLPNIWLQKYVQPYLTELFQISYSIYWVTIPLGTFAFYYHRQYQHVEHLLNYVTLTFFISYFFFIFLPVAGPRFYLASQIMVPYDGLFFSHYLRNFMTQVGYRGGAFPSSHVGVAVVILVFIWHFRPRLAAGLFLPLVTALSLATVYGQYHYVTDVLSGLLMGLIIGFWGGPRTRRYFKENQLERSDKK